MDTTVTQQQKEEEMLQTKMASTQFFVSEEEEEKEMPAQAKVAQKKSAPESDNAPTLGGTTTKMPEDVQAKMRVRQRQRPGGEGSFGTDFSAVNIHQNDPSAKQMGALAYTQGNDISFANGQYNPNTQGGQELLGHELTHVVQQNQSRVSPTKKAKGIAINDSPALENEADVMGKQAAQGKSADVSGKGSGLQLLAGGEIGNQNNKKTGQKKRNYIFILRRKRQTLIIQIVGKHIVNFLKTRKSKKKIKI